MKSALESNRFAEKKIETHTERNRAKDRQREMRETENETDIK